jgi:hypothetical protein
MRWTRLCREASGKDADDETVWSCPPDAGVKFAGNEPASDGGYKARYTGESAG